MNSEKRVSDEELSKCAFEDQIFPEVKAVGLANRLALDLRDAREEIKALRREVNDLLPMLDADAFIIRVLNGEISRLLKEASECSHCKGDEIAGTDTEGCL